MKQEYVKDLIETYADSLTRLAFSYTKNLYDAQDIVQDVFVCLMEKGEKKLSEEHMRAWLIRVTINKCKNQMYVYSKRRRYICWRRSVTSYSLFHLTGDQ